MSKMRIKKHKGVKLLETRHPPPKKNSDDEDEEEKLLQCIMCNCMTIEEYLKRHIRYNHLISKEDIIDKLYNLHYPTQSVSVSTQTSVVWIDDLEHRGNPKDDPDKGKKIRPKHRHQREVDSDDNDRYKDGPNHGGDDEEEVLCPACGDVEDGTPMIACDLCDRWYHWACVGLNCKPPKGQEWMCTECSSKKPHRKIGNSVRFPGNRDGPGPSGVKPKVKRNLPDDEDEIKVTAVVKPKRGKLQEESETPSRDKITQRRLSGRGKSSPNESSRRVQISTPEQSKKRFSSSDRDTPRSMKSSGKRHDPRDHSPRKRDTYGSDLPKKKSKHNRQDSESDNNDQDDNVQEDLRYSDDSTGDKDFEPHESDYDERDMKMGEKVRERRESQQKFKKHKKKFARETDEFDAMSRDDMRELSHKEMINASGNRDDLEQRLRRHFRKKREGQEVKKDKKKYKLAEVTEGDGVCKICGLGWNLSDDLELGPLYKYGICQAHLHCLMFSSGLIQGGDEKEGIVGFMPDDVLREWQRGAKLKCTFCKEIYATVGCCQRTCMKTYHLPCGIKYGALNEYYGNFDSYCPLHRSKRTPKNRAKNYVLTDLGLVPEHVDMEAGFDSEKYKAMMKKLESETSERRKSTEKKEISKPTREDEYDEPPLKKEKKDIKGLKKRQEHSDEESNKRGDLKMKITKNRDKQVESSDDEDSEVRKKRPGPKSKTMIKKKKVVEEFETAQPPESSDEDTPLALLKKIKPTSLKKPKVAEDRTPKSKSIIRGTQSEPKPVIEETTGKREGKRIRKSTFGSDIYSSAQDELKKLLEKKHMINIDETFTDLAGTRRARHGRTTSVVDEDNDDDDEADSRSTGRSQSRSGRKCAKRAVVEVDDEEDFGSKSFGSKIPYTKRQSGTKDLEDDEEKVKNAETIESIEEFLGDSKTKKKSSDKRKKRNSGPDSTDELIESDEENQKEESPEAFNDENSKSPPTPNLSENEFEDTEQDSGHENLEQNDGFTDCADLSNVTSDEGTDADIKKKSKAASADMKVMFNDDENDEQMDLSGLIQNLEKDDDKKPITIDTGAISRFKCPFCAHHSKSKKRIEQHISYSHNRKNLSKNLANKQEMMIFVGKHAMPDEDKGVTPSESSQYSSDDMAEAVVDKEEVTGKSQGLVNKNEPSETKRVRKKASKGGDFVHWDEIGKKSEKNIETVAEKESKSEVIKDKKDVASEMQANIPRKRGRQPKQGKEQEIIESKNIEETPSAGRPRRQSPRKEAEVPKEECKEIDTGPELKLSLRGRNKKTVETNTELEPTNKEETVETPRGRRGRPKKEVAFEEPPSRDLNEGEPKIEEQSQSDTELTPKRRRTGRPKKEEVEADTKKNMSPVSILSGESEDPISVENTSISDLERTPRSGRRSGRSKKDQEKEDEDIKSPPPTLTTSKRTRQTPKQELKEDKKINEVAQPDTLKENESKQEEVETKKLEVKKSQIKKEKLTEEKLPEVPEATQSDADSPTKGTRRGRKPKGNVPTESNEALPEETPTETTEPRCGSISPTGSIAETMFECLKCGTKIMQTQELVLNHLKRHKFSLEDYIDNYSEEGNSDKFSAIMIWKNDDSIKDIKAEPSPQKKGSRKGGRTPVKLNLQNTNAESESVAEQKDEVKAEMKVKKKSSPFKLLFSTVGDYDKEPEEDKTEAEPEIKLSKVEEKEIPEVTKEMLDDCATVKESNKEEEKSADTPIKENVDNAPEKVEPDSTTNMEDVFDQLSRSSRSSKNMPESKAEDLKLIMKYTDEKGSEVKWVEGNDESGMPEIYIEGKQSGKVDLKEIEHALDQDVQIPEQFKEMLPLNEDKEEENKRIVLRIKKVKS
eukprot:GFUD01015009.1.p1 GENE.GFUD01015009.1~~GFUD01015009.1.p1  ORF type:complete len:1844 (+),score=612.96 GFUD01015009.1:251-5782(+)